MIDDDQIAMLVYTHVVQLTLIDYEPNEAFVLAHHVAAFAFDSAFTRAGLDAARKLAPDGPDGSRKPPRAPAVAPKR